MAPMRGPKSGQIFNIDIQLEFLHSKGLEAGSRYHFSIHVAIFKISFFRLQVKTNLHFCQKQKQPAYG